MASRAADVGGKWMHVGCCYRCGPQTKHQSFRMYAGTPPGTHHLTVLSEAHDEKDASTLRDGSAGSIVALCTSRRARHHPPHPAVKRRRHPQAVHLSGWYYERWRRHFVWPTLKRERYERFIRRVYRGSNRRCGGSHKPEPAAAVWGLSGQLVVGRLGPARQRITVECPRALACCG